MTTALAARRKHRTRRTKSATTKVSKRRTTRSGTKRRTKRRTTKHGGGTKRRTKRKSTTHKSKSGKACKTRKTRKTRRHKKTGGAATVSAAKVRAQAKRLKIPLSFVNKAGVRKKKSVARLQAAINYRGHH